jgi:predicted AlkP superfamily pyrophosphatase or phosphodiesterase
VEGVSLVITPKDFAKYGMADPQQNPQMADMVLSAKSGYSFSDSLTGNMIVTPKTDEVKGTHGYDPNEAGLHGTFVAWGAGVQPAKTLGTINNTDVAPTLAVLLGLKMQDTDGKVLVDALKK